jgi:TRAP transporter T-component
MAWYLIPLFLVATGCGTIQKYALRSSTPVFEKSSDNLMKEGNWEFFKAATPGNLKFLELLYLQDKENYKLLSVLIRSYSAYAFTVHETLAIEDQLAGVEDSQAKKDAILFYTRSLDYGLAYMKHKGVERKDLLSNDYENLKAKLKKFDEDDLYALLYTAQSWGSLINLQKDNIVLVSQIPNVKLLFDRACWIKHNVDQNVCDMFFAQYETARPKMLGGDPEKGEAMFIKSINKHPNNLLIRATYILNSVLPAMDAEKYEKQAEIMRKEIAEWEDINRDSLESLSPYKNNEDLNLYNSIAKKRFLAVEKYKTKIFE